MSSQRQQCIGTAKSTKQRCKLLVQPPSRYCHYHVSQETIATKTHISNGLKTFNPHRYQTGFIYVYTLEHLLSKKPQKVSWLKYSAAGESKDFDPKEQILIKVGLTQGRVSKRVRQWEAQCGHKLCIVEPNKNLVSSDAENKSGNLVQLFMKLRIGKKDQTLQNYSINDEGFIVKKGLGQVETQVHQLLRHRFGHGDVLCCGCQTGLHREWFKVPRGALKQVFLMIDEVVNSLV